QKLTYRELNEKSNSLGRALREKGVREEKIVGIIMDRSIEMIIGIMGILKAGGAYLPIDPEYPIDRIKYMLEDSKAEILLTQNKVLEAINYDWNSINIEIIDVEDTALYEKESINIEKASSPYNLAYVIYTSGTTGKPKGVMIEHRSAAGTLLWRKEEYKLDEKDNVLVLFSYAFDGFVTNFFTTIISGAAAVLIKSEESKDAFAIRRCITQNKITHFICVPILYGAILECSQAEDLQSLRVVTLAGDKTSKKLIQLSRSKNEKIELVNEYGPTENSVASTVYRNMQNITEESVPIGRPRTGTKAYILDKNNFLMPIGTIGELCLAGNGLARGYLNREELTAEKFAANPFEQDAKMYRTGDLARWLPDGNIEFVGRIDNQVKVRGFRVELGEIENQLLKLEGIKEAVVVDRSSDSGDVYLAAYITAEAEIAASSIKEELSNELPSYMIPNYIMQIEELPVTVNGKVDRKELPEID
ncbi:amino acid adenylation domain-containing protein, partial [Clostridium puniceum]|uniref:amino acid adenylation domain-containing protein n=1 Tax=Clostridium puniceum TaxID=29367 RepID=UPI0011788764